MKEVVLLVAAGVAAAIPAALALSRVVRSQLFEIQPNDPITLVGASFLLAFVAVVAGLIPARRAARIDPIQALRHE